MPKNDDSLNRSGLAGIERAWVTYDRSGYGDVDALVRAAVSLYRLHQYPFGLTFEGLFIWLGYRQGTTAN